MMKRHDDLVKVIHCCYCKVEVVDWTKDNRANRIEIGWKLKDHPDWLDCTAKYRELNNTMAVDNWAGSVSTAMKMKNYRNHPDHHRHYLGYYCYYSLWIHYTNGHCCCRLRTELTVWMKWRTERTRQHNGSRNGQRNFATDLIDIVAHVRLFPLSTPRYGIMIFSFSQCVVLQVGRFSQL